jgi:hypothetical protein
VDGKTPVAIGLRELVPFPRPGIELRCGVMQIDRVSPGVNLFRVCRFDLPGCLLRRLTG